MDNCNVVDFRSKLFKYLTFIGRNGFGEKLIY